MSLKHISEFLAVNPRGLVPAIINKGRSVYESSVCVEYVDEMWQNEPRLLPTDPYERAVARIWVDFIGKKIVTVFYRVLQKQNIDEREEAKAELLKNLEILTQAMSEKGPFFLGENFGIVDIILVSYASRLFVLKHYRDFEVPHTEKFARFHRWLEAAQNRPSFKATMPEHDTVLVTYEKYADNTAQSELADAIRKGTAIP